jgi:hypothetical protein
MKNRKIKRRYAWLKLDQVPEKDRKISPDGKRVAAWFVAGQSEDRYDWDTSYHVAVWDAATKEEVAVFYRCYNVSYYTGAVEGKRIVKVDFTPDGKAIVITYEDGSSDQEKLPD